jgi:diguanylate cyclase (GGDEF)-like protein
MQPAARRILVVDDDPTQVAMLRRWYAGQPITILEASNGTEGAAVAARERPDLVLMDMMMPGVDGVETTRVLKRAAATRNIPVILLSARREVEQKLLAFEAGADDYVTKPFDFDEVDARIRAMLRKRDLYLALEDKNRELEDTNRHLEELLVVDEKTGLANYRHFRSKLREEWLRADRYRTPLSLVMIDLDDFKRLNDTVGHPAGDRVLREVATLVAGGARATDMPARFGGEEFSVILPHTDSAMAARVAERILAGVRQHVFLAADHPCRLTASAGVATYPSTPFLDSPDALVQCADQALYRAKAEGKDRVTVHGGATDRPRSEEST